MHPCPRCLPDEIPVRQSGDLPAPSFRFHLTMDTLGVRLYPSRYRADSGLAPVGTCARRAHEKKPFHAELKGLEDGTREESRTPDQKFRKLLLYPLSYPGKIVV